MKKEANKNKTIENITIVGGGTAGWLTATFLTTVLNRRNSDARVAVTLIESPHVPNIGVGEATVPGMYLMLQQLRINEPEFFLRCNATFKCGVRFVNWSADESGESISFIHPFNSSDSIKGIDPT